MQYFHRFSVNRQRRRNQTMTSVVRRTTVVATSILASLALVAPGTAAASKSFKIVQTDGKLSGNTASGHVKGTFGRGTVKGTVTPPTARYTFKFKNGTIKVSFRVKKIEGTKIAGP